MHSKTLQNIRAMRLVGTVLLTVSAVLAGFFLAHSLEEHMIAPNGPSAAIGATVFIVLTLLLAIGIEMFSGWSKTELDEFVATHNHMREDMIRSNASHEESSKGQERISRMLAEENHDLREQLLANKLHEMHALHQMEGDVSQRERDVQSREDRADENESSGISRHSPASQRGIGNYSNRNRRH